MDEKQPINFQIISKKITDFFSKNYNYIFSIIGQLVILGIVGYAIFSVTNFVTNLKGFTFDPVLILSIIVVSYFYLRNQANNQNLMRKQNEILEKLVNEVVSSKKLSVKNIKSSALVSTKIQTLQSKYIKTKKRGA